MRILNLYAGIGGNRWLWGDHQVVAVENNREVADYYQSKFKDDTVVLRDAHEFLIQGFRGFDFIWSSPPCPTHSKMNTTLSSYGVYRYPDMKLYEEIIFLSKFFKGKFVVENVDPYYKPLLDPTAKIDRHLFWSNFPISDFKIDRKEDVSKASKEALARARGVDVPNIKDARKALRNMVHPLVGKHIFDCAIESLGKKEGQ